MKKVIKFMIDPGHDLSILETDPKLVAAVDFGAIFLENEPKKDLVVILNASKPVDGAINVFYRENISAESLAMDIAKGLELTNSDDVNWVKEKFNKLVSYREKDLNNIPVDITKEIYKEFKERK